MITIDRIETEVTGSEFNKIYAGSTFVKLTNSVEKHFNFQYNDGLNIDTIEFNPSHVCSAGGLYFMDINDAHTWLEYQGIGSMKYIRKVLVPDDARVYIEYGKFKADKIILEKREIIYKDIYMKAIKRCGFDMAYVPIEMIDKEMCLAAAACCSRNTKFKLTNVPSTIIDKELCLMATQINIFNFGLNDVPKSLIDRDICMAAVRYDGRHLRDVPLNIIDKEICLEAIKENSYAIVNVPIEMRDRELCIEAVNHKGILLHYVPLEMRDKEMCEIAVKQDRTALEYVPDDLKQRLCCDTHRKK